MKRRAWIVSSGLVLIAGLAAWFFLRSARDRVPHPDPRARDQSSNVAIDIEKAAADSQATEESRRANDLLLSLAKVLGESPSVAPIEKTLRESSDPLARKNTLTDLLNVRYGRSEAIRVLNHALSDPSTSVRVRAAELLYILGSSDGKAALLDVIRSGIDPETTHLSDSVNAARILTRFGETIPVELLSRLYDEHPHPGLLRTMAMQGDTRYFEFLVDAFKESPVAGNVLNLGILGAPDGVSVVKDVFESTAIEQNKVAAAWALFRIGGDRAALDYVLDWAALGVTAPKPAGISDSDSIREARRAVFVTKDEAVRDFLRQAVSAQNGDVGTSSLASLFYVQQDYGYVDAVVREYFSGDKAYQDIDPALIWRIAALRKTPTIDAAARAKNREAYNYYFVQLQGRAARGWIGTYLDDMPIRQYPAP